MSRVTVTEGLRRATHLIPFDAANLSGQGVYVCTPVSTIPEQFRKSQTTRNAVYMRTGHRSSPGYAPMYVVTSYGTPIAWVSLDGRTHFASRDDVLATAQSVARAQAMSRHRDTLRANWPTRFPVQH